MNIFYLDEDPAVAAISHCDKHCVKMILETAQLLSTAHRVCDGDEYADEQGLYRATHKNHPSAIWVRETVTNYAWTYKLLTALCAEYTARYGKVHSTERLLKALRYPPQNMGAGKFKPPPQCMPDECKHEDTVTAYRTYYLKEKIGIAEWRHSHPPKWWVWGVA